MDPEADDPETVAIHKIIAHIAAVYRREGAGGLARHMAEWIALKGKESGQRKIARDTKSCYPG